MNHDEAKKLMAAEAYILDDLEPAERAAFEEHFFDCTDCTSDVLDASTTADGIRTRSTPNNVIPMRHYQSRWAVAAAGAAVVIGLAYAYVPQIATELPQLAARWRHPSAPIINSPRVVMDVQHIELDQPRAGATPYKVRADRPVEINFDIQDESPQPPYFCELSDGASQIIGRKTVGTKEEARNTLAMTVAAGRLHPGKYTLAIRGGTREIPPFQFVVEAQ